MHEIHHICEEKHSLNTAYVCQNLKEHFKRNQKHYIQMCKKETAENYQPKEIRRWKENRALQGKTFCFK